MGEHGGAAGMITGTANCATNTQIVLFILSTKQGAAGVLNRVAQTYQQHGIGVRGFNLCCCKAVV